MPDVRRTGRLTRSAWSATSRSGTSGWLLVKMRDEAADARRDPRRPQSASVLSGRTLEQVADAG
jgi:hypothetical protein